MSELTVRQLFADRVATAFLLTLGTWLCAGLSGGSVLALLQLAPVDWRVPAVLMASSAGWVWGLVWARRELATRRYQYGVLVAALAALASVMAGVGSAWLMRGWLDLMSEPYPTPAMVAKDLCATFGPFVGAFAAPLLVLTLGQPRAVGSASEHAV